MADFIVRAENLSKQYRILPSSGPGWRGTQHVLVDDIARFARRIRGDETAHKRISFWALKDVSFEARSGDVIGIIGRNGAGKSTLLKLLGRVTPPTLGRATIYGRIGSLLEVGTGFHSELTGRENIFISGSIIGMSRAEIKRKFDEIVAFSGVEQFLDTPVKRYSSGMEVRLAFSVAAHLEPNILLVDEVLAVGDASFQQKSIKKIKEVAEKGGTILFISHNMTTVASICTQVMVLDQGKAIYPLGPVNDGIATYLVDLPKRQLAQAEPRDQDGTPRSIKLTGFTVQGEDGNTLETLTSQCPVDFLVEFEREDYTPLKEVTISIQIKTIKGEVIANLDSLEIVGPLTITNRRGIIKCHLDKLPLASGHVTISASIAQMGDIADRIEDAFVGEVDRGGVYERKFRRENHGWILIDQDWSVQ